MTSKTSPYLSDRYYDPGELPSYSEVARRYSHTGTIPADTARLAEIEKIKAEQLAKFNPNHDERGRFSSADSSGGASEGSTTSLPSEVPNLTKGNTDLKQYLEMVDSMHKGQPNVAKMLIDHGRGFEVDAESFIGGTPQQCYKNAAQAAWSDPELTYVEGYVGIHGVPIAHAWTTDKTGKVRDVTLSKDAAKMVTGYYGVPIKRDFLTATLLKSKVYGILTGSDNPKTVQSVITAAPADVVEKA